MTARRPSCPHLPDLSAPNTPENVRLRVGSRKPSSARVVQRMLNPGSSVFSGRGVCLYSVIIHSRRTLAAPFSRNTLTTCRHAASVDSLQGRPRTPTGRCRYSLSVPGDDLITTSEAHSRTPCFAMRGRASWPVRRPEDPLRLETRRSGTAPRSIRTARLPTPSDSPHRVCPRGQPGEHEQAVRRRKLGRFPRVNPSHWLGRLCRGRQRPWDDLARGTVTARCPCIGAHRRPARDASPPSPPQSEDSAATAAARSSLPTSTLFLVPPGISHVNRAITRSGRRTDLESHRSTGDQRPERRRPSHPSRVVASA